MTAFLDAAGVIYSPSDNNADLCSQCFSVIGRSFDIRKRDQAIAFMDAMPMRSTKGITGQKKPLDFYASYAWKALRFDILKASDGRCQLCGSSKHDGAVLHVDHIKPRSKFPHLSLDRSNLQVLCSDCNMGKSNRDSTDWRQKEPPYLGDEWSEIRACLGVVF